jgi:hypothetical protein
MTINPHNTTLTDKPSATLWFFSPRHFTTQAKRPLVYQFNTHFVEAARDALKTMIRDYNRKPLEALLQDSTPCAAMLPGYPDHSLNMRDISELWTFRLSIDHDNRDIRGISRHSINNGRDIYYGYIVDEPVGLTTPGSVGVVNPRAQLYITHKTVINCLTIPPTLFSGHQPREHFVAIEDLDVIHPRTLSMMSPEPIFLMRPVDLFQSRNSNPDGFLIPLSLQKAEKEPVAISAMLNIPHQHIIKILHAIGDANASLSSCTLDTVDATGDLFDELVDMNLTEVTRVYGYPEIPLHYSIDVGDVMARYRVTVNVSKQKTQPDCDRIDQSLPTARNVEASLLATVIPAMMTKNLIASLHFNYVSETDVFRVTHLSTLIVLPDDTTQMYLDQFFKQLKTTTLPMLKNTYGDFHLSVLCTPTGITTIDLNFLCDDSTKTASAYFEVPTILGGCNSPLIGTADAFAHNARELAALVAALTQT